MKQNLKIGSAHLPGLQAFALVARHGSFSRAADELGVSPSALSQTIRQLEASLGAHLLNRTTRRVGLTEAGARLLAGLTPGLARIEAALAELEESRDQASGTLRINLPRIAYRSVIAPHLAGFMARYPGIQVEFNLDDGFSDIIAGGFDAGIRLGESLAGDMIAARLGPPRDLVVAGSPDYFRRRGRPLQPQDLLQHDCLLYRFQTSGRIYDWEFMEGGQVFDIRLKGPLILNDPYAMLDAACQGLGLIYAMRETVAEDVAAGRLEVVLADWSLTMGAFYLYYPNREQMPLKLRAFIDWFQQAENS